LAGARRGLLAGGAALSAYLDPAIVLLVVAVVVLVAWLAGSPL
jgi:hypothetical protein